MFYSSQISACMLDSWCDDSFVKRPLANHYCAKINFVIFLAVIIHLQLLVSNHTALQLLYENNFLYLFCVEFCYLLHLLFSLIILVTRARSIFHLCSYYQRQRSDEDFFLAFGDIYPRYYMCLMKLILSCFCCSLNDLLYVICVFFYLIMIRCDLEVNMRVLLAALYVTAVMW